MPIAVSVVLRIVLRRAAGNRRLVAAMVIGVTLAVALMASTAIYRDALDELGLKFDLENADKSAIDIRVSSSTHLAAPADYDRDQAVIDQADGSAPIEVPETTWGFDMSAIDHTKEPYAFLLDKDHTLE